MKLTFCLVLILMLAGCGRSNEKYLQALQVLAAERQELESLKSQLSEMEHNVASTESDPTIPKDGPLTPDEKQSERLRILAHMSAQFGAISLQSKIDKQRERVKAAEAAKEAAHSGR